MGLERVKRTYEAFGLEDPFYAVLTIKTGRNNGWALDEFYETGRREVAVQMRQLGKMGVTPAAGRALDFGCGVGRLSQALAAHFDEVVGVDIAASMIEKAREHNQFGDRCRFLENNSADLRRFDDGEFDLVYSNITLQHIPPRYACGYIGEFFRVLRPGGAAVFRIPSGPDFSVGGLRERLYNLQYEHWRPLWKKLRGKRPVQVHYVARRRVEEVVEQGGGQLIAVHGDKPRGQLENLWYFAAKPATSARRAA